MLDFIKKLFQPKIPNAAIAWQQAGNDAGNAYWLYAAPVHLLLQRDSFSLAEPLPLTLQPAEIDALTADLNAHFSIDGMQFFWHQTQWFLRLEYDPHINTTYPKLALHKDINSFLPAGEGAMAWATFQNELQMLLFSHPVNIAREASKSVSINSLWCYGGGHLASGK